MEEIKIEETTENYSNEENSGKTSPLPPKDTSVDLVEANTIEDLNNGHTQKEDEESIKEAVEDEEITNDNDTDNPLQSNSITNSTIVITKSQIQGNENDDSNEIQGDRKLLSSLLFNKDLVDSTFTPSETQEESQNSDTENENEEVESKVEVDLNESCVEIKTTEAEKEAEEDVEEVVEAVEVHTEENLVPETQTSDKLENENSSEKKDFYLTNSCVDLGKNSDSEEHKASEETHEIVKEAEESKEILEDLIHNNSMEIIEKKQCENTSKQDEETLDDEEYEKVEAETVSATEEVKEAPKRKLEDEEFEKPLGGDSLLKKIVQYGEERNGRDWRPSSGQMCIISYEAFIKDTQTSVEKNEDLSFILGDGDVVSAIDLVVSLMCKDEKCEVISEARHAYGTIGKKPDIPSNASLFYKIHLKDFRDLTDLNSMDAVERLSLSEAKKLRGNFHFNRQDFHLAVASYKKGLKYFDLENLKSDEEKVNMDKFVELKKALLMNLALSDFKQTQYKKALNSLNEVLSIEETHMKALYIRGKVYMHLGETQEAILSLSAAHELAKDNKEVKNELLKAQTKHKQQYEKEKKMYQKMMRSPSSEKKASKASKGDSKPSPVITYAVAGLLMAGATLGIAMFAKYKNLL